MRQGAGAGLCGCPGWEPGLGMPQSLCRMLSDEAAQRLGFSEMGQESWMNQDSRSWRGGRKEVRGGKSTFTKTPKEPLELHSYSEACSFLTLVAKSD